MVRSIRGVVHCGISLSVMGLCVAVALAVTPEQTKKGEAIDSLIQQATEKVKAKEYPAAGTLISQAQDQLTALASEGAATKPLVSKLHTKLASLHRTVAKNGVELAELPDVDTMLKPPKGKPAEKVSGVSFTREIVPIFTSKCGGCHVNAMRGQFSMATYNALMKGSPAGVVFTPGKSKGSRLIDVLESGDMPRGGGKLADAEIAKISKWIDEGAKYDGPDPNARIAGMADATNDRPKLEVTAATGKESTRFSRDIAGVLAANCVNCHGGRQPRAQLSLETFTAVLRGSNMANAIVPGDPKASLLIKKIKGEAGARMPLNGSPLPPDVIEKFEKWVAEGAKFDGRDPGQDVEMVSAVYKASVMSHEELAAHRVDLGLKNYKLAVPEGKGPGRAETENFLLLGDIGDDRLAEIGKEAEKQADKVGKILKAPAGEPLLKGKLTLFVFGKRYNYSEFGQMVEKREIPSASKGHFRYTVVDAYGCVLAPTGSESIAGPIAQQVAGAYAESLGYVPRWFSQGISLAVASRVDQRNPQYKQLYDNVPAAMSRNKPAEFFAGNASAEDAAALSLSFADYLMGQRGFTSTLTSLRKGATFEDAFVQGFKGTPATLSGPWSAKVASSKKKR